MHTQSPLRDQPWKPHRSVLISSLVKFMFFVHSHFLSGYFSEGIVLGLYKAFLIIFLHFIY